MPGTLAVLTAMEQEGRLIEAALADVALHSSGGRRYVSGLLGDVPTITVISGFGKVAAAATVATVLERFRPEAVLFAGVAGGVGSGVGIGDVVVADALLQHDFDASPLFDRFVIPSLGVARIPTDPVLTDRLLLAARNHLAGSPGGDGALQTHRGSTGPALHRGLIVSGDRFIDSVADTDMLLGLLPDVLAVEMEGAAIAQVCTEADVPFAVFRSISDRADAQADVDFLAFIETVAAPLTAGIVAEFAATFS